jgi:hypothetical protein
VENAHAVPLSGLVHIRTPRCYDREDRAHGIRPGLFIDLMEQVDLHPALTRAPVLGSMDADAPSVQPLNSTSQDKSKFSYSRFVDNQAGQVGDGEAAIAPSDT